MKKILCQAILISPQYYIRIKFNMCLTLVFSLFCICMIFVWYLWYSFKLCKLISPQDCIWVKFQEKFECRAGIGSWKSHPNFESEYFPKIFIALQLQKQNDLSQWGHFQTSCPGHRMKCPNQKKTSVVNVAPGSHTSRTERYKAHDLKLNHHYTII